MYKKRDPPPQRCTVRKARGMTPLNSQTVGTRDKDEQLMPRPSNTVQLSILPANPSSTSSSSTIPPMPGDSKRRRRASQQGSALRRRCAPRCNGGARGHAPYRTSIGHLAISLSCGDRQWPVRVRAAGYYPSNGIAGSVGTNSSGLSSILPFNIRI